MCICFMFYHIHPHVLRCPLFWMKTQRQEHSRSQSLATWVIISLSIRHMGRSSGISFHSEILFISSGIAGLATFTEGTGSHMTGACGAQWVDSIYRDLTGHLSVRKKLGWRSWIPLSSLTEYRRGKPSKWLPRTWRMRAHRIVGSSKIHLV